MSPELAVFRDWYIETGRPGLSVNGDDSFLREAADVLMDRKAPRFGRDMAILVLSSNKPEYILWALRLQIPHGSDRIVKGEGAAPYVAVLDRLVARVREWAAKPSIERWHQGRRTAFMLGMVEKAEGRKSGIEQSVSSISALSYLGDAVKDCHRAMRFEPDWAQAGIVTILLDAIASDEIVLNPSI